MTLKWQSHNMKHSLSSKCLKTNYICRSTMISKNQNSCCIMFYTNKHMVELATLFVSFYGGGCVCACYKREQLAAKQCMHSLPQLTQTEGKISVLQGKAAMFSDRAHCQKLVCLVLVFKLYKCPTTTWNIQQLDTFTRGKVGEVSCPGTQRP